MTTTEKVVIAVMCTAVIGGTLAVVAVVNGFSSSDVPELLEKAIAGETPPSGAAQFNTWEIDPLHYQDLESLLRNPIELQTSEPFDPGNLVFDDGTGGSITSSDGLAVEVETDPGNFIFYDQNKVEMVRLEPGGKVVWNKSLPNVDAAAIYFWRALERVSPGFFCQCEECK